MNRLAAWSVALSATLWVCQLATDKEIVMATEREILTDLTALRDEARVQLHLLSMDARARWQKLETRLANLERELDSRGEKLSESTLSSARSLKQDLKTFLKEHDLPLG